MQPLAGCHVDKCKLVSLAHSTKESSLKLNNYINWPKSGTF